MLQGRFHELLREVFRSRHPALANILLRAGTQHSDGDCHEFIRLRQLGANRHETLTASARPGLAKLCMGNLQGAPLGSRRHSNNSSFEISFRQQELQSSFPYKITSVAARVHQHPGGNHFAQRVLSDFSGGTAWTQLGQVLAQNGLEDLRASLDFGNTLADAASMLCRDEDEDNPYYIVPDGEGGQQAFAEEHIQACSTFIADIVPIVCDGCVQQRKPIAH